MSNRWRTLSKSCDPQGWVNQIHYPACQVALDLRDDLSPVLGASRQGQSMVLILTPYSGELF